MQMNVAGIVSEYNPFHNGHKYMIDRIRQNGVTHVVAVMSGAAVQRGDIAIFDKHFRAEKAVENGVDLVLELPFPYSCSSGETFARSAVSILAGLGENVVNTIAFGCEIDALEMLKKAADITYQLKSNSLVKDMLSKGLSYPDALCQSAKKLAGDNVAKVLESPNNTLAIEYIKAAKELLPNLNFMPIKRAFAEHDTAQNANGIASASLIRELALNGKNADEFCPYSLKNVPTFSIKNAERQVLFCLASCEKSELLQIADCSTEIADKIKNAIAEYPKTLDKFFAICKSRNVIMARLRRITMQLVLGAKKSDIAAPPFARVLAFNKKGAEVLAKSGGKLPVDTSLKALEDSSDYARRIVKLENNAVLFQNTCANSEYSPLNEYRRFVTITE